jgi:predicted 3-demethylubiquinone-9 3-methyltransferase (glyoxalase superfamily)
MEASMQKITPHLWFDNQAEEAVNFYISIFKKNSKILDILYNDGKHGPGPEGSALYLSFLLNGQEFMAVNGGPEFKFNPSVSFYIRCKTQDEIDYFWNKLLEGGKPEQCGWLVDKYGLSWQVIPEIADEMLRDKDKKKVHRVMDAMFKMVKIDLAELMRSYESEPEQALK